MRNKVFYTIVLALVVSLFNSCETPPIEAAQEAYDYNKIQPKVLGVTGPSIVIQTFTGEFTLNYHRGGSTWNWSAENATVESVSEDTRVATLRFNEYPADGTATITVTETTMGGLTSEPVSVEVTVQKYCPLQNGVADLAGHWTGTGTDGYPADITTVVSGSDLEVSGLSEDFIQDWWGEKILEGGSFKMTVNVDGTMTIPRQYIYTTEWDGAPYRYEIEGSGTWDNCGATPSMTIEYDIYYEGDPDGLGATYGPGYFDGITFFTVNIQMD